MSDKNNKNNWGKNNQQQNQKNQQQNQNNQQQRPQQQNQNNQQQRSQQQNQNNQQQRPQQQNQNNQQQRPQQQNQNNQQQRSQQQNQNNQQQRSQSAVNQPQNNTDNKSGLQVKNPWNQQQNQTLENQRPQSAFNQAQNQWNNQPQRPQSAVNQPQNNTDNKSALQVKNPWNQQQNQTLEKQRPQSDLNQAPNHWNKNAQQNNNLIKTAWSDDSSETKDTNDKSKSQIQPNNDNSNLNQEPIQQSTITSVEENIQQIKIDNLSDLTQNFPLKPKERCTLGRGIELLANHYAFHIKAPISVYHYDINIFQVYKKGNEVISKEVKSKEKSKDIFYDLLKKYPNQKNKMFYDNKKSFYSMDNIGSPLEINLNSEKFNNDEFLIKIKIVKQITINVNEILDQNAIQILQLIFTQNLNYKYVPVYRSFFSDQFERKQLGFNIDLWKGFFVSVRPSEMGFNLNVDVANAPFFNKMNIIDLACDWYESNKNDLVKCFENDKGGYSFLNELLRGKKVKNHLNYSKKIENFGKSAKQHVFPVGNEKLSVQEYFKRQGINLKFPDLPCLLLGKDNHTPMELCETELTVLKKLTPDQTSQMIRSTAVPCNIRKNDIYKMITSTKLDCDPILQTYNINIKFDMTKLNGRVLEAPDLLYKNTITSSKQIGIKGQWDNMNKIFLENKELKTWIVLNCSRLYDNIINNFISSLVYVSNGHGLKISQPIEIIKADGRMDERRARELINKNLDKYKTLEFIFAILPGTSVIYNVLKTIGDIEKGIPSQAIDEGTIKRQKGPFDQLTSNICLKINAKLGGKNFNLSKQNQLFQKYLQNLYDGPLMIFGADVNHSIESVESIAAVVGSVDSDCSYYAARMHIQQQPKGKSLELIINLRYMIKELLDEYFKANKIYPKRLIFIRDGVSEGQFKLTRRHEMNEIREACQKVAPDYKPAVTFLVVQKRHHTRLFPVNEADNCGKSNNVPPGTLVDSKIITPDMFDFFLCSHKGIQGTSKPCHYFILHDENNFSMNQITLLCHYLCHIYTRSTTSVSYPAPTYYADLCAERGRCYILNKNQKTGEIAVASSKPISVHDNFKNKMFFI